MSDQYGYGRDQRGPYQQGGPVNRGGPELVGPPPKKRRRIRGVVLLVVSIGTLAVVGMVSCTALMFDGAVGATSGADKAPHVAPPASQPGPAVPTAKPAKKWVPLTTVTGGTEKTSDTIRTTGGKVRVTWKFVGGELAMGAIYLLAEGTDLQSDGGFPVAMVDADSKADSIVLRKGAGEYFVQVRAVNAKYSVTVEEER